MKSQNTKTSSELKREVHQELHKVRKDIDELQGRLTPGQILDDAIFYPNDRNLNKTFSHLKRNPIGTTFLSLGTLLLMEDENHASYESVVREKVNSGVSSAKENISSVKGKIKDQLPRSELTPGVGPNRADRIKHKVAGIADSFQTKVSDIKSGIASKIPDKETYLRGKEKIQSLDNNTFMLLGAGLGALTGASLPISEAEGKMIEDRFSVRLGGFNAELREAMNEC
jgi:hypothetical protein